MAKSRFRIRIDGTWTAKEMADLFQSCDTIYGHLAQLHSRELQRELTRQTNEPSPVGNSDGRDLLLKVTRVSYGSPGWADFFGAGELVGHLKDFVLEIIKLVVERRDREQTRRLRDAQVEAAILENYSKQLEMLDKAFDLANRADLNAAQRQSILNSVLNASRPLGQAAAQGKLLSAEDIPDEE